MPPTSTLKKRLKAHNFEPLSVLGCDDVSEILLCAYHGYNKSIKAMCDEQCRIVIKVFDTPEHHEITIAAQLTDRVSRMSNHSRLLFNLPIPFNDDKGILGLMSRYETFSLLDDENNLIEYAANLESFLANTFAQSLIMPHLAIFLCQMATCMKVAQNQLHAFRLLHLNTILHNFWVTLQYDDFGDLIHIVLKLNDYSQSIQLTKNHSHDKATILTDLSALKACIIDMLALIVMPEKHDTPSLGQIKHHIETHENSALKRELQRFITIFEPYLTTLPNTDDFETAKRNDWILFRKTIEHFTQHALIDLRDDYIETTDNIQLADNLYRIMKISAIHPELNTTALHCVDALLLSLDQEPLPVQTLPQGENYYG